MPFIIHESHAFGEAPYDGPSCQAARVLPGKYYETAAEAQADVAKLEQVNAVGWVIAEVQTYQSIAQKFPKMEIQVANGAIWIDTKDVRNPFTISDLLLRLTGLTPERPVYLTCDGTSYEFYNRRDLHTFGLGFQLREGLYNVAHACDLKAV